MRLGLLLVLLSHVPVLGPQQVHLELHDRQRLTVVPGGRDWRPESLHLRHLLVQDLPGIRELILVLVHGVLGLHRVPEELLCALHDRGLLEQLVCDLEALEHVLGDRRRGGCLGELLLELPGLAPLEPEPPDEVFPLHDESADLLLFALRKGRELRLQNLNPVHQLLDGLVPLGDLLSQGVPLDRQRLHLGLLLVTNLLDLPLLLFQLVHLLVQPLDLLGHLVHLGLLLVQAVLEQAVLLLQVVEARGLDVEVPDLVLLEDLLLVLLPQLLLHLEALLVHCDALLRVPQVLVRLAELGGDLDQRLVDLPRNLHILPHGLLPLFLEWVVVLLLLELRGDGLQDLPKAAVSRGVLLHLPVQVRDFDLATVHLIVQVGDRGVPLRGSVVHLLHRSGVLLALPVQGGLDLRKVLRPLRVLLLELLEIPRQLVVIRALVRKLLPRGRQVLLQLGVLVQQLVVLLPQLLLGGLLLLQHPPQVLQVLLSGGLEVPLHDGVRLHLLELGLVPRDEHLQRLHLGLQTRVLRVELVQPPVLLRDLLLQFLNHLHQVDFLPVGLSVQALLIPQQPRDLVQPLLDPQPVVDLA